MSGPAQRAELAEILATVRGLLGAGPAGVRVEFPQQVPASFRAARRLIRAAAPPELGPGAMEAQRWEQRVRDWAQALRRRREAAGMSAAELAARVGLLEADVLDLESGRCAPVPAVLAALTALLWGPGLQADPLLHWLSERIQARVAAATEPGEQGSCGSVQGFDPLAQARTLVEGFGGPGGHVEQALLYLDPLDAARYLDLSALEDQRAPREPLWDGRIAAAIVQAAAQPGAQMDVLALGPGGGTHEVELVRQLALGPRGAARLILLDSSQPLLGAACGHAQAVLSGCGVRVTGLQGRAQDLPRAAGLMHPGRRRVVLLLGATLGHLRHELRWVQECLSWLTPGDLLLLEADLCGAAPGPDPGLGAPLGASWWQRCEAWLGGLVRRHHPAAKVALAAGAQAAGAGGEVPGSHCVEWVATVPGAGPARRFVLLRHRRYPQDGLDAGLWRAGFGAVAAWRYGAGKYFGLFRRMAG